VTKLERHCRLLLKAYPAAYRRERAEEIVGLLLDVTPEGRNWPTGRDVRGLLAGGIRARAAIGQRPFSTVSYRTPVLVGIATFLATDAVADLRQSARFDYRMSWYWHWQGLITAPLILAAVVLAWLGCKRVYVFAAAWDAAVSLGYWLLHDPRVAAHDHWASLLRHPYPNLAYLGCLAGLVALSGGNARPRPGWVVPAGLIVLGPVLLAQIRIPYQVSGFLELAVGTACAACIAWIAIEPRPAIALTVFLLARPVPHVVFVSPFVAKALLGELLFGAVVAFAGCLLTRPQSAGAPRRHI